VAHLLVAKAPVDIQEDSMGRSPLHLVAARTPVVTEAERGVVAAVVDLLVEAKAAQELKDKTGMTPLLAAAQVGQAETLHALMTAKADTAAVDLHGHTALQLAHRAMDAKKDRWPQARHFASACCALLDPHARAGGGM